MAGYAGYIDHNIEFHLLSHGQNFCKSNVMISVNMTEEDAFQVPENLPDARAMVFFISKDACQLTP